MFFTWKSIFLRRHIFPRHKFCSHKFCSHKFTNRKVHCAEKINPSPEILKQIQVQLIE